MCGIFGFVAKNKSNKEIKLYLDSLLKLSEPRGTQATGVALKHQDEVFLYKRPINSSRMIKSKDYEEFLNSSLKSRDNQSIAALGHCRLVTDGGEHNQDNNQPIQTNKILGIHNGVINNFKEIQEAHHLDSSGSSDSEILFKLIENQISQSQNIEVSTKEMFNKIMGSAAISFFIHDKNSLYLTTNFGSFYFARFSEDFIVFASEEIILTNFKESFHFNGVIEKFPSFILREINLESLSTIDLDLSNPGVPSPKRFDSNNMQLQFINKSPSPKNIRRCKKCILPENYPFLEFDKNGVCSICNKYKKQKYLGKEKLAKIFDQHRSKNGKPDCLIGLSGGRDSSYGLHLLKNEFGMNPVGFTYDWLLTSKKARHNIAKMAGALDVEVIYRCGNYPRQAANIRNNIEGFLKDPHLGMMTFVQAGDKEMYHWGRKIRKEKNLPLTVWCSGFQLEQREFFVGYCGINKTLVNNPRLFDYGWSTKLQLGMFYTLKTLKNPSYWNRSIWDNFLAYWHCFIAKDDFLYLFNYYPWVEQEMERTLNDLYAWEADSKFGENQWRMDDVHTAFNNYVYYSVGGFSEFDDFRSNQIREGLITRDEALKLVEKDNATKYEALKEFASLIGFNLEHVLKEIDSIPKLYRV